MKSPRSILRTVLLLLVVMGAHAPDVAAQSLDEQYKFFLSAKCLRLNLDRIDDIIPNDVLPGLLDLGLDSFCSGLPPVGGGTDASTASTGIAGSMGRAGDVVLRQRQVEARGGVQPAGFVESDILSYGSTSVFAAFNYAREDQQQRRFEGGRRSDLLALTVGLDNRLGSSGLIGFAGSVEDQSGDFDAGGDFDNRGYSAMAYASWMPGAAFFLDVNGGVTFRDAETSRIVSFTRTLNSGGGPVVIESIAPQRADSQVDQRESRAALLAGYDFSIGGSTFGPRLAGEYRRNAIDRTVEGGDSPMALVLEEQLEKSLRSGLGLQLSHAMNTAAAVFVLQLNADWWHEFEDDQRDIEARFAQDRRDNPTRFTYQTQPPDRDTFTARLSLSATMPHGFSVFASVDGLIGHSYLDRYGAALGLRKEL